MISLKIPQWLVLDAVTAAGLVAFGVAYNALVQDLRRRYGDHGYTAILVVAGVVVTVLAVAPRIGLRGLLYIMLAFICSGVPMIAGDVRSHLRRAETMAQVFDSILSALDLTDGGDNATNLPATPGRVD